MVSIMSTNLCDICENRNKTSHAIKWCLDCEEKLCDECYGMHSASRRSRNHDVIDIEQYQQLPKSILDIKNVCDQHDMDFVYLCGEHDALCCPACTSGSGHHVKCKTKVLKDVIQTAKTSVLLQSVEETLTTLTDNLRTIINERRSNLIKLQDQTEDILKEVKQMKEKIINRLIAFEKNISDELDKNFKKNEQKLKSEIANLENRMQQAETMSNDAKTMKKYGSDLQIFMGSRSMENEVGTLNNNVQELVNDGNITQVVVTLKWDTEVNEIIERMSSLGSLLEEEIPVPIVLESEKGTQVQVLYARTTGLTLEDINITQKAKFQIAENDTIVYGCSVFPNGKMICAVSKNIILFKDNGQKEKVFPTPTGSYDVATIDDTTVAGCTDDGVELININTKTVGRKIKTGRCEGLAYYKGSLLCCVSGRGVLSVELSTGNITTVVNDTVGKGWYYCTVYNDMIYTTRSDHNAVTCYTMEGDEVWEFKDSSVIHNPRGISIDKSANVYVASLYNRNIVALSPDGQRHRTLLTQMDGINRPRSLHVDRSRNQLLVGNESGRVLLFTITNT